jgi:uncharacterized zinc-type alcohol dehydrogenase-like protein
MYPMVPGHEIIGRVKRVGANVTSFKEGDRVGVGCMVDSCQHCKACAADHQQYCENHATYTYNAIDRQDQTPTVAVLHDEPIVYCRERLSLRHGELNGGGQHCYRNKDWRASGRK